MKVEVFYKNEFSVLEKMAIFNFVEAWSVDDALEAAYFRSQNLNDSWSIEGGSDHAGEAAEWIAPLVWSESRGCVMGHRSSMVGDIFKIDNKEYRVAFCGFKEVEKESVE